MPARRRRYLTMALMALLDDPKLLLEALATTPAGVDHLEPANLRTVLMPGHKDSQQHYIRSEQAALTEGVHCGYGST
jgi:hypothetical protein